MPRPLQTAAHTWCHNGFRIELGPSWRPAPTGMAWWSYRLLDDAWASGTGADPLIFSGDDLGVIAAPTLANVASTDQAASRTGPQVLARDGENKAGDPHLNAVASDGVVASAAQAVCDYFAQCPGDVADGYFSHYTSAQLAWRNARAHHLSLCVDVPPT